MRKLLWRLALAVAALLALAGHALAFALTVNTNGALYSVTSLNYQIFNKNWDSPNGYKILRVHLKFQGRRASSSANYTNDWIYLYYKTCSNCGYSYYGGWTNSLTRDFWVDLSNYNAVGIRVTLYTSSGLTSEIAWADAPEVTVDAPPWTPGAPSLVYDNTVGQYQQKITWSTNGNPAGTTYELWRRTYDASGNLVKDERIYSGTGTMFTTTDQVAGRYYRYRVRAIYNGNTSADSPETPYWTASAPTVTPGTWNITVSWPAVYPGVTYRVYWKQDNGNWSSVTTTNTSYTLNGLTPSSNYYFALAPVLPSGGTDWWSGNTSTPYSPLYEAPSSAALTGGTATSVTINWSIYNTSIPTTAKIRITRNGTTIHEAVPSSYTYTTINGTYGRWASYTDSAVSVGQTYTYVVCALNAQNQCGGTRTLTYTPQLVPPGAPTLPNDTSVPLPQQRITWSAPTGNPSGTQFEIWRKRFDASGQVVADEQIATTGSTSFVTTDSQPGNYYTFRVRAVYGQYTSQFSPEVAWWVAPQAQVSSDVQALVVSWQQPYPNLQYTISWEKAGSGAWQYAYGISGNTYRITGLDPSITYNVRVAPYSLPSGGVGWSIWAPGGPFGPLYPIVNAVAQGNTTQTSAEIWWAYGYTGARIRVQRNGQTIWEGVPSYSYQYRNGRRDYWAVYSDTGLQPGTSYTYTVCAVNAMGQCGPGQSLTVVTVPPTPATPTGTYGGLGWAPVGRGYVVLNWQPVQGATGYAVWVFDGNQYRRFDVGNTTTWDSRQAKIYPSESWLDGQCDNCVSGDPFIRNGSGLDLRDNPNKLYRKTVGTTYDSATNYWFRVSAYNGSGESPFSSGAFTPTLPDQTDPTAPTVTSIQINGGATITGGSRVRVTVSATDDKSGLTTLQLSNDGQNWTTVGSMSGLADSETVDWQLSLGFGVKTVYARVQDQAGNWSQPASAQILYQLTDVTGPQVSLKINGGASSTDKLTVTLTIEATDDQTPQSMLRMRFSNDGVTWSQWEPYQPEKSWTLSSGEGKKTVWVEVQDSAGNPGSATATIFYRASLQPVYDPNVFSSTTGSAGQYSTGSSSVQVQFVRVRDVDLVWNTAALPNVRMVRYGSDPRTFGAWETIGNRAFSLSPGEGIQTLYAQTDDGRTYMIRFLYDATAPDVTVTWKGGATVTGPGGTATLVVQVQDNLARPEDCQVSVNGGPFQAWAPEIPVTLSGSGPATVTVKVRDPAGNVTTKTLGIYVLP